MRYAQPQTGPISLDTGNSITRGLVYAFNPGTGLRDIAKRRQGAPGGTAKRSSAVGVGIQAAANSSLGAVFSASPMSTSAGNGTGDFAFVVVAAPIASTTREFFVCVQNGAQEFYFGANFGVGLASSSGQVSAQTNAGGAVGVAVAGKADGRTHVFGFKREAGTGYLWIDGVMVGSYVAGAVQMWSSASNDYVGGYSAAGWGGSAPVSLVLGFNRAPSDDEMLRLTRNLSSPWQVFAEHLRPMFTSAGGPQSLIVTPSGGLAFSGLATVIRSTSRQAVGGLTLAGAATVRRGVARATSGGLTLAGAAAVTRGAVRLPTGGIVMAGTAPIETSSSSASRTVTPTGGIAFAGTAPTVRQMRYTPTGGVVFGGAAGYTNSGVVAALYAISRRRARPRVLTQ